MAGGGGSPQGVGQQGGQPMGGYGGQQSGGFGNSFGGGYGGQQPQQMPQQMQRPMQNQFGGFNQSPQMGGYGSGMGGGFGGGFNQPPQMGGFGGMQNSSINSFPDPRMRQNQGQSMSPMQGFQQMQQQFGQQGGQGLQGMSNILRGMPMDGMRPQLSSEERQQRMNNPAYQGLPAQPIGENSNPNSRSNLDSTYNQFMQQQAQDAAAMQANRGMGQAGMQGQMGFGGQGSLQRMQNQNIPEYARAFFNNQGMY